MLAVRRKVAGESIKYAHGHGRNGLPQQPDPEHIGAAARDQRVQQQLEAQTAWSNSQYEEGPIQRIPRADLEVGQERKPGEQEWSPEGQMSTADRVGEVALRAVVHVD